ncbi:MAG: hypothetical protein HeimAB125_18400 [Candidatus Heimdallarchaeota archaeon AB_125]|nr:MAG: hypothetical protein HeimAB125_18400 [Candidatus Heimdallarchaeota archaeon AB_125]
MTRLLISEGIAQKAEEDLEKLLISRNLRADSFNYSPYILRIVNEILLEKGYCLGLGEKTEKSLIDKYWINLSLAQESDIVIRIVSGPDENFSWNIVLLIKDNKTRNQIWRELLHLKKLKPKNDRVIRGTFSKFDETSREIVINQITEVLDKKTLTYKIEEYSLDNITRKSEENVFEYLIPSNISFSCTSCNMCELPSNYSINPIPNKNDKPFQDLFTKMRIGFPSNLACLSLSEGIDISSEVNQRIEEFCHPVAFQRNKDGLIVDYQLALKQDEGLCVFHNKENGLCGIHDYKPLSCYSYPFLTQKKDDNHYIIELDFSCPGIKKNSSSSLDSLLNCIQERLTREEISTLSFNEIYSLKWNLSEYFRDGERVYQEDVDEALDYLSEKYEQHKES